MGPDAMGIVLVPTLGARNMTSPPIPADADRTETLIAWLERCAALAGAVDRTDSTIPKFAGAAAALRSLLANNRVMRGALTEAADHFDKIAGKADHWARTFAANPDGEARWTAIRNHARHRAVTARTALSEQTKPVMEGKA